MFCINNTSIGLSLIYIFMQSFLFTSSLLVDLLKKYLKYFFRVPAEPAIHPNNNNT